MKLNQLSDNVFYLDNPSNIGIYRVGKTAYFIDTGLDDDTARKALGIVAEAGMTPVRIFNTHHHADHCGGNSFIQSRYAELVTYAPSVEAGIIMNPVLEQLYLAGGAVSLSDLDNKFIRAKPSKVDIVIPMENVPVQYHDFTCYPLYGHSPRQVGYAVDDVFFCADSVFSEDTLKRHKIPFHADVGQALKSFDRLRETSYKVYVPSHGEPVGDINSLADANESVVRDISNYILDSLHGRRGTDEVVKQVCDHYGVKLDSVMRYALMRTAICGYLNHFCNTGDLGLQVCDNSFLWFWK